ncbi:MAG TPA: carbon starvation CstA family protein [Longimicrobiales bacterium]|nr:carbon starvation CstA family protein [Longimicrobiales bacterium]
MSVLLIVVASISVLFLGGRYYAPVIARVLGEVPDRPTPAVCLNDGRDYVPTQTPVVFAHHFASIAGAGPIIGPVLAIYFGWGPALLWILLGGIFLGGVHDYASTHIAVREGGKSIAVIARRYIGTAAFVMLLIMLIALLVLVCAAFLDLSATALTSRVAVETLQLSAGQSLFRVEGGQAIIGGIASTSVIVITAFSPLIGYLYLKRAWPVWLCSLLAIAICAASIAVGLLFPVTVQPETWKGMISVYVLLAAGLPVWMFLQSRDFINVHILYIGVAFLVVAVLAAAVRGGGEFTTTASAIPFSNWGRASAELGPGWPLLFVTIACGAVSGFHSLCAGGTTCKQLKTEIAARHVGYYAMLLESFLAVCVVLCLIVGLSLADYKLYCYPDTGSGNAVLAFAMSVGHTANVGLGVPIAAGALGAMLLLEGFLVTTLDTAVRLTRYMIEEGWAVFFGRYDVFADAAARQRQDAATAAAARGGALELAGAGGLAIERPDLDAGARTPVVQTRGLGRGALKLLRQYWFNSGIAVGLMLLLGWGNGYAVVWQIFGSANQLLAALALVVATSWLVSKRRPVWYTLLPAAFMLVTSMWMLVRLLVWDYVPNWSTRAPLAVTAVIVLTMTTGVVGIAVRQWVRRDGPGVPAAG